MLLAVLLGIAVSSPFPVKQPSGLRRGHRGWTVRAMQGDDGDLRPWHHRDRQHWFPSRPSFLKALSAKVGADQVAFQEVDYPADIPGFLRGGDPQGSKTMWVEPRG